MSMIAAAIVGSAVVSGVVASRSAGKAADASREGSALAADATVAATQLQVDEIGRQFDYGQAILLPKIQAEYNASGAYSDLLGIGGPTPTSPPGTMGPQQAGPGQPGFQPGGTGEGPPPPPGGATLTTPGSGPAQYPAQGATNFMTGDRGQFVDPNIDPTRLADINTLPGQVQDTLLAGGPADQDEYFNYVRGPTGDASGDPLRLDIEGRSLEAGVAGDQIRDDVGRRSLADDVASRSISENFMGRSVAEGVGTRSIAEGAAGTGVYGEEFEASRGYEFAVEEMGREQDRKRSAGGNYGGRAMMEATRRAKGLADQEYYNWAAGRTSDLQRRGTAEAADIGRMDTAEAADIGRMDYAGVSDVGRADRAGAGDIGRLDVAGVQDIQRGDVARGADTSRLDTAAYSYQGRSDRAYENYLGRRAGDATRLDAAAAQEDRLMASDQQRGDQSYYNYLGNLSNAAGLGGNPAGMAVQSSTAAGNAVANAYGQQGANLGNIYYQGGQDLAQINYMQGYNTNQAIQGGVSNYVTASAAGLPMWGQQ